MNWFLRFSGILTVLLLSLPSDTPLFSMGPPLVIGVPDPSLHSGIHHSLSAGNQAYDPIKLERPAKTAFCPGSDAIVLKAPDLPATYRWHWNGSPISGLNTNTQVVSQPGIYYAHVRMKATGEELTTDTITLTRAANPTPTLTAANPEGALCERDSLRLMAGGGVAYQWFLNRREIVGPTSAVYLARQAGQYSVTVTDANGCHADSDPITVTPQVRPKPVIDFIPTICGINAPVVTLNASPPGGTFSGPGVRDSLFDPQIVGYGIHPVYYQSLPTKGCAGDTSQLRIRVSQPPSVQLPTHVVTSSQGIFPLEPTVTGNGPFSYRWQPAVWLSNPTYSLVTVTLPKHDTTYTVRVQDAFGCVTEASVRITLRSKASIPDAFTPNGDYINDTWKIPGIESYPKAHMTISNRWGEVVFRAHDGYLSPFDGRLNGEPLPTGVYLYVLKLSPDADPLRGSVLLVR